MSHGDEQLDLDKAVRMLWAAHGRKADSETCAVWAKSLRQHVGPALWRVLREGAESKEGLPNLGEVLEKIRAIKNANAATNQPKALTPEERERSDKAAVLSMLWLHHVKGWPLERFAGSIFERRFGRDPTEALRVAAQTYDRALVEAWMEDQKRAGN